ncbi:hypothetical protein KAR04_05405, partial [Candidatus Calescamantes bacterium]|nr:hypothetical protein [Candidatus Calescamantes bacterium]
GLKAHDPNNISSEEEIANYCFSEQYINGLINLIKDKISPPFSLSIDGNWGTGKTHLLKILERKLKEEHYPTIWFNPWEYEKTNSAYLAFINKVSISFRDRFKISFKTLGIFGLALAVSSIDSTARFISNNSISYSNIKNISKDVSKATKSEAANYKDTIQEIKRDFVKITRQITTSKEFNGKPIIIFLDDLDRCLPKNALELLEALKNTFNVKDSTAIFICGQNVDITRGFINSEYPSIDVKYASNYLKKIFDYSIKMPGVTKEQMKTFIGSRITEVFGSLDYELTNIIQEFNEEVDNRSLRVIDKIISGYFFYNSVIEEKSLDIKFVIFWLFFKEIWPETYNIVLGEIMKETNQMFGYIQKLMHGNA